MKNFIQLFKNTFDAWKKDEVPQLAAALSYSMIFSLAPLILLLISGLSLFLESEVIQSNILSFFKDNIGIQSAEIMSSMIKALNSRGNSLLTNVIGTVLLIIASTSVFIQLQSSFNKIWQVEIKKEKRFKATFKKRLFSLLLIFLIGILLLASFIISAIVRIGFEFLVEVFPPVHYLFPLSEIIISVGIMGILFSLMFLYLPDVKLRWSDVWRGGFLTSLLFFVGKFLIGLYFSKSQIFSSYGAASSMIAILLWVYYSSLILFSGAEFTKIWVHEKALGKTFFTSKIKNKFLSLFKIEKK